MLTQAVSLVSVRMYMYVFKLALTKDPVRAVAADQSVKHCHCIGDYTGLTCNVCVAGLFKLNTSDKCVPCHCSQNSKPGADVCDPFTGTVAV